RVAPFARAVTPGFTTRSSMALRSPPALSELWLLRPVVGFTYGSIRQESNRAPAERSARAEARRNPAQAADHRAPALARRARPECHGDRRLLGDRHRSPHRLVPRGDRALGVDQ